MPPHAEGVGYVGDRVLGSLCRDLDTVGDVVEHRRSEKYPTC